MVVIATHINNKYTLSLVTIAMHYYCNDNNIHYACLQVTLATHRNFIILYSLADQCVVIASAFISLKVLINVRTVLATVSSSLAWPVRFSLW